eukprot:TRINITY_DN3897_c0_g1_i1.p1 TRINITY_DN3897_c0_g1~~TRINITY_DN3897_c0_g1_i1.p1  ORF type:complete len:582 (-),score=69.02 TRINITY_DN3897_c0_g1_i1:286-2031(-)
MFQSKRYVSLSSSLLSGGALLLLFLRGAVCLPERAFIGLKHAERKLARLEPMEVGGGHPRFHKSAALETRSNLSYLGTGQATLVAVNTSGQKRLTKNKVEAVIGAQGLIQTGNHLFREEEDMLDTGSDNASKSNFTRESSTRQNATSLWMAGARNVYAKMVFGILQNNSDEVTPFAKVRIKANAARNSTTFEVEIASFAVIISVYLLMYVPLAMAWAYYFHLGEQIGHYKVLLLLTVCAMVIGQDLVNQSLSVLMQAPMAITSVQSIFMFVAAGVWTLASQYQLSKQNVPQDLQFRAEGGEPTTTLSLENFLKVILRWTPAGILFAIYQVTNHYVSYYCSLSERTVFLNLCPLVSLFLESSLMPQKMENLPKMTFSSKMALVSMAFGALLFSLQYPDFTLGGLAWSMILVATVVPYRLLQKWLLKECREAPAALLCSLDGLILALPAIALSVWDHSASYVGLVGSWKLWLHSPSILLMLLLSLFTFLGNHMATLLLLRVASATSTLVYFNIASFVCVFNGIFFFGDHVVQAPLVFIGIMTSLLAGVWYTLDQFPAPCCLASNEESLQHVPPPPRSDRAMTN